MTKVKLFVMLALFVNQVLLAEVIYVKGEGESRKVLYKDYDYTCSSTSSTIITEPYQELIVWAQAEAHKNALETCKEELNRHHDVTIQRISNWQNEVGTYVRSNYTPECIGYAKTSAFYSCSEF